MKVTLLELRRNPGKIIEAVERGESVTVSRRGADVARVVPTNARSTKSKVTEHPAFGMWADARADESPSEIVRQMRRGRFHDL